MTFRVQKNETLTRLRRFFQILFGKIHFSMPVSLSSGRYGLLPIARFRAISIIIAIN